jgi:hypothetical protein
MCAFAGSRSGDGAVELPHWAPVAGWNTRSVPVPRRRALDVPRRRTSCVVDCPCSRLGHWDYRWVSVTGSTGCHACPRRCAIGPMVVVGRGVAGGPAALLAVGPPEAPSEDLANGLTSALGRSFERRRRQGPTAWFMSWCCCRPGPDASKQST